MDDRYAVKAVVNDHETVMEIEGMEIIGPYNNTYREKLKAVRLVIDGVEKDNITCNELMCPPITAGAPNIGPSEFRAGQGEKYGGYGNLVCTNFGKGMLAGGPAINATPKVGPGQSLGIKVQIPRTSEGGAAITAGKMRVRLHTIQVRSEAKLKEILEYHGLLSGGNVDCSWTMGDLANTDVMPITQVKKQVGDGNFGLKNWSQLPGGNDVGMPYLERFITYAQNANATTENTWYDFTMEGTNVTDESQELAWNLDRNRAIKIEHIGVMPHNNLKELRLWIDGSPKHPQFPVDPDLNCLPMPMSIYTNGGYTQGPARLGKGMWVWNNQASIQIKDNGTAVPAWTTAPTRGAMVAVWGYRYKVPGGV